MRGDLRHLVFEKGFDFDGFAPPFSTFEPCFSVSGERRVLREVCRTCGNHATHIEGVRRWKRQCEQKHLRNVWSRHGFDGYGRVLHPAPPTPPGRARWLF